MDIQLEREVVGLADVIAFALVLAFERNHIGHGSEFNAPWNEIGAAVFKK
ncbi:hypothetical protein [Tardiphaga sp. 839_C3_N1_4]